MLPLLQTDRFQLRPLVPSDSHWIATLHADPKVMRFIPSHSDPAPQSDQRLGYWAIEDRSRPAVHGWVALKRLEGTESIEIGFRLFPASWGQGVATEAALRVLRYAFEEAGVNRCVAVCHEDNVASRRVIEKLGMRFETTFMDASGAWPNFSITSTAWRSRPTRPTTPS